MTQAEFDALIQSLLEEGYTVDELEASASQGNFEDDFGISLPNFAVGINAQTAIQGAAQKANASIRTANRIKRAQCNRSGGFNKGQGDNHECLQGAEAAAHIATIGENAPAYDRGQEWLNNNPQYGPELTQWQQARDFIIEQVESGNASQANQDWYNRWVASGSPDTQEGMMSAGEYQWSQNKNTIIDRVESGNGSQADQDWYDRWVASGEPDSKDGMWSPEQYHEWLEEQDNEGGTDDGGDPVDPGPEPPQTLDDLLSEIAEEQQVDRDVVDGVVDIIETIKGSIPTDLESASDLIKGVLSSTVLGSALEECESWTGNTTTEGGRGVPSWTKCVDVGIFGIPGLDLPLPPGMVDISTSVYDIIQKGEDIGESFEDFLEDPSGWLENVIDKAVEKVQEVWGDLQAGVDPKTIGGLSGILNDWIGNILGGYILSQVKDATSAIDPFLYAGDCLDPTFKEANKEYCEEALNEGALVDCSAQFGKTGGFVTSADQCGACENTNWTPTGANGECVDPDPNDCEGQNKSLNSDGTCGDCLDNTLKDFGQGCEAPCQYDDTIAASNTDECKNLGLTTEILRQSVQPKDAYTYPEMLLQKQRANVATACPRIQTRKVTVLVQNGLMVGLLKMNAKPKVEYIGLATVQARIAHVVAA